MLATSISHRLMPRGHLRSTSGKSHEAKQRRITKSIGPRTIRWTGTNRQVELVPADQSAARAGLPATGGGGGAPAAIAG